MLGNTLQNRRTPRSNLDRNMKTIKRFISCATMVQASIWRTSINYLELSNAFIRQRNFREQALGLQPSNGLFIDTADVFGQRARWVKARHSSLRCRRWKVYPRIPQRKMMKLSGGQRKLFD